MRIAWMWPALALLAAGCGPGKPASARLDPAVEKLIPADTVMLVSIRMEAVRQTAIYTKVLAGLPSSTLDRFARETGLDPRRDVSELVVAGNGKDTLVIGRGKLAVSELGKKLESLGARRLSHKGRTLWGSEETAVAFPDSSTAVAGPTRAVRAALDSTSPKLAAPLSEALEGIPAGVHAWAVWLAGGLPLPSASGAARGGAAGAILQNAEKLFGSLGRATLWTDLQTGLKLEAAGECAAEPDAKKLHDALRGLIGFARLQTRDDQRDMLAFYDAFEVTVAGPRVRIKAEIAPELLDKFLQSRTTR